MNINELLGYNSFEAIEKSCEKSFDKIKIIVGSGVNWNNLDEPTMPKVNRGSRESSIIRARKQEQFIPDRFS
jgi:copper homeostasis protein CutC